MRAASACRRPQANQAPRDVVPRAANSNHGATGKFLSLPPRKLRAGLFGHLILEDSAIIRRRSKPMSLRPIKGLIVIGSVFLLSTCGAPARTPSPEATSPARGPAATLS